MKDSPGEGDIEVAAPAAIPSPSAPPTRTHSFSLRILSVNPERRKISEIFKHHKIFSVDDNTPQPYLPEQPKESLKRWVENLREKHARVFLKTADIIGALAVSLYFYDMVSDVRVALELFDKGRTLFASLVTLFILWHFPVADYLLRLPPREPEQSLADRLLTCLFTSCVSLFACPYVILLDLWGFIMMYGKVLGFLTKIEWLNEYAYWLHPIIIDHEHYLMTRQLIEVTMESVPQVILQTYLYTQLKRAERNGAGPFSNGSLINTYTLTQSLLLSFINSVYRIGQVLLAWKLSGQPFTTYFRLVLTYQGSADVAKDFKLVLKASTIDELDMTMSHLRHDWVPHSQWGALMLKLVDLLGQCKFEALKLDIKHDLNLAQLAAAMEKQPDLKAFSLRWSANAEPNEHVESILLHACHTCSELKLIAANDSGCRAASFPDLKAALHAKRILGTSAQDDLPGQRSLSSLYFNHFSVQAQNWEALGWWLTRHRDISTLKLDEMYFSNLYGFDQRNWDTFVERPMSGLYKLRSLKVALQCYGVLSSPAAAAIQKLLTQHVRLQSLCLQLNEGGMCEQRVHGALLHAACKLLAAGLATLPSTQLQHIALKCRSSKLTWPHQGNEQSPSQSDNPLLASSLATPMAALFTQLAVLPSLRSLRVEVPHVLAFSELERLLAGGHSIMSLDVRLYNVEGCRVAAAKFLRALQSSNLQSLTVRMGSDKDGALMAQLHLPKTLKHLRLMGRGVKTSWKLAERVAKQVPLATLAFINCGLDSSCTKGLAALLAHHEQLQGFTWWEKKLPAGLHHMRPFLAAIKEHRGLRALEVAQKLVGYTNAASSMENLGIPHVKLSTMRDVCQDSLLERLPFVKW